MPEIENIHIVSHSLGTDVSTTALRELVIENRAAGGDPTYKKSGTHEQQLLIRLIRVLLIRCVH